MSPSTHPQTFRETVAQVAERARAILPTQVNGRIESAVKLVLAHDVEPQADGSILVGSASDPLKQYRLEGHTCECQDFTRGQAPDGWCQHRIAAGIQRRVGELRPVQASHAKLETLSPAPETAPPVPLPEAPASVNCHILIEGRQVQLTLRDTDEARLLARLAQVLAQYPVPQPAPQASHHLSPQQHNAAAMHRRVSDFCPVHQTTMQLNQKAGRS